VKTKNVSTADNLKTVQEKLSLLIVKLIIGLRITSGSLGLNHEMYHSLRTLRREQANWDCCICQSFFHTKPV